MYADDFVLVAPSAVALQNMLNFVHEWYNKWQIEINAEKSQIVHFRKPRQKRSEAQFRVGNHILSYAAVYKYLGVYFDENVNMNYHEEQIAASGNRALGAIIGKFK